MTDLVLGVAIGAYTLLWFTRYQKISAEYKQEQNKYADMTNKALQAEAARAKAEAELAFLQQAVVAQIQRPVVAALTDTHVHDICQTVAQLVMSYMTPKEQQN